MRDTPLPTLGPQWKKSRNGRPHTSIDKYDATVFNKDGAYSFVISCEGEESVFATQSFTTEEGAQREVERLLCDKGFDYRDFAKSQRWRTSRNGNRCCTINGETFTVFSTNAGRYGFVHSGEFCSERFDTEEEAIEAVECYFAD